MIDIYKEVEEIFDDKIRNATKYNGDIFRLTELSEQGSYGDIINYLESHPNPEQEKEKITKALEDNKVFYVANDSLIIYDPEEKAEEIKEVNKILAKNSEDRTEEEQELLSRYI